jgi:hypothetical protein
MVTYGEFHRFWHVETMKNSSPLECAIRQPDFSLNSGFLGSFGFTLRGELPPPAFRLINSAKSR